MCVCEGIDGSSLQSDPEKLKVVEQFAKEENVMEVLFYENKKCFLKFKLGAASILCNQL